MAEQSWLTTDFYQILGVAKDAKPAEITRAYRKLAKQLHPDTNPAGTERFKTISAAYEVLGDKEQRAEYDALRAAPPSPPPFTRSYTTPPPNDDFADMFSSLFRQSSRNLDVEASLTVDFRDAVRGMVTTLNLTSEETCAVCAGTGAAPGTPTPTCSRCQGRGMTDSGPFALSSPCPDCQGRGYRIESPCTSCHGARQRTLTRPITVRVPSGVEDGQRIRLTGHGRRGSAGAGDLYITILVTPDLVFTRDGLNLHTTAEVDFPTAALGGSVIVPTLDQPVTLRVPAHTQPGSTLRVRGRGVIVGTRTGDLLVSVRVQVPRHLNEHQRDALRVYAETLSPVKVSV